MSRLRTFAGLRSLAGGIAQCEDGYLDDGIVYNLLAITDRVFPAGVGGEASFDAFYVLVTYSRRFRLYVSPIVDGALLPETLLDPLLDPAAEITKRFEVPLRIDALNSLGQPVGGKVAPRGGWFQLKVRTAFDATYQPGAFRIDEVLVTGDVVVESLTPLAGAGA